MLQREAFLGKVKMLWICIAFIIVSIYILCDRPTTNVWSAGNDGRNEPYDNATNAKHAGRTNESNQGYNAYDAVGDDDENGHGYDERQKRRTH